MASVLANAEATSVLVLDNGSAVPFEFDESPHVKVIRSPVNLGVAAGRNRLAAASSADLVCFLDSDAQTRPKCLSELAMALSGDPRIAVAGPVFDAVHPDESAGVEPSSLRKLARGLRLTRRYRHAGPFMDGTRNVDFVIGACQMVRRDVFERIGGFDESIFFGPEDLDLCVRLRGEGFRTVQVESAVAIHQARRSHRNLLSGRGRRHAAAVLRYHLRSARKLRR